MASAQAAQCSVVSVRLCRKPAFPLKEVSRLRKRHKKGIYRQPAFSLKALLPEGASRFRAWPFLKRTKQLER
ncbi:MAG: hypothetical protein C4334_12915 [Pyrinomonas sp.]